MKKIKFNKISSVLILLAIILFGIGFGYQKHFLSSQKHVKTNLEYDSIYDKSFELVKNLIKTTPSTWDFVTWDFVVIYNKPTDLNIKNYGGKYYYLVQSGGLIRNGALYPMLLAYELIKNGDSYVIDPHGITNLIISNNGNSDIEFDIKNHKISGGKGGITHIISTNNITTMK